MFAAPGDGSVRFAGPQVLTAKDNAMLEVSVTNASAVRATYTVVLSSTSAAFNERTATKPVDEGARALVRIPINASRLGGGRYTVTATLSSDLRGAALSTDTVTVMVYG